MERVHGDGVVPAQAGSELAVQVVRLDAGAGQEVGHAGPDDELWFVFDGGGSVEADALAPGSALFVAAGESVSVRAGGDGLAAVRATIGPGADLHAPLGGRERVVSVEHVEAGEATGSRSFQVLFGPKNGSTRATMFVGYIPPGRAPWHYHLYDEIVWVWRGTGRYHLSTGVEELPDGAAFRVLPREVHIVENLSENRELVVLGIFSPAGSPSAAYLLPDAAAEYSIAPRD
jgi:quercetin dioxygenase-like cupin family protein